MRSGSRRTADSVCASAGDGPGPRVMRLPIRPLFQPAPASPPWPRADVEGAGPGVSWMLPLHPMRESITTRRTRRRERDRRHCPGWRGTVRIRVGRGRFDRRCPDLCTFRPVCVLLVYPPRRRLRRGGRGCSSAEIGTLTAPPVIRLRAFSCLSDFPTASPRTLQPVSTMNQAGAQHDFWHVSAPGRPRGTSGLRAPYANLYRHHV